MRWNGAWCCAVVAAVGISVNGWAAPPDKPVGIDVIRAYEGTWTVSVQYFDTPYSKASVEKNTLHNDCWKSGGYFACNQYVNGESKVLLVFTYDQGKNEYTSYQIPQGGAVAGSGKLFIEGDRWTYPWQTGQGPSTTYFRVVNVFTTPDRIEFRQEYSTDQVHWTPTGQGSETRKSAK